MTGVAATPPLCGPSGGAVASPSPAKPAAANAEPLKVLSLFAGIGGFDLGLERTGGFKTVAFCEIDPFCHRVLAKHWPKVPCYEDVRELTAERLAADGIAVDVICGGFPCQDISTAGAGAGIEGERSGLWADYARLIGELRPIYVIVENVAALLSRGMGRVLGDLAALRYDAIWHCIPASYAGLLHGRDRVWIVAHPTGLSFQESTLVSSGALQGEPGGAWAGAGGPSAAREADQPSLVGLADGVPAELDSRDYRNRSAALGNTVVPQIPELIGRAILKSEAAA